jgi:hypothetical protein
MLRVSAVQFDSEPGKKPLYAVGERPVFVGAAVPPDKLTDVRAVLPELGRVSVEHPLLENAFDPYPT